MKKLLLLSLLSLFLFSQKSSATPVDFIKPKTPTEKSIQPKKKKKKKKFFNRMMEKVMKRRLGKMIKKLKIDSTDCVRIIKTDGEEIEVIIIKEGPERIRYKSCDFQNGPTRSIRKEDIFMIKYPDGKKEVLTDVEGLRKNQKQVSDTSESNNKENRQYWIIGYILGIFLGVFALLALAIVLNGTKRKKAIRGAVAGILTVILFLVTITLLFSSFI